MDLEYNHNIAVGGLEADMVGVEEPESEAASLLMHLPDAYRGMESPKRALSISELIL